MKINLTPDSYEQENQALADNFLEHYFYDRWAALDRLDPSMPALEIIVSPKCNLACKYCYIHRHHKDIFDYDIFNEELTINNLKKILSWLEINHYHPHLDIFSGELFAQEIGYKILDTIYEWCAKQELKDRPSEISIPTNFTFICDDNLVQRVLAIRQKFFDIGIRFFLSASFDGAYMESNRPFAKNLDIDMQVIRDSEYYDKVFKFCAATGTGLHPMIYSEGVERWKNNFLWFQEKMKEFDIPWYRLYLLQVRNEEWTQEQIHEFQDFIRFLYEWLYNHFDQDSAKLADNLLNHNGGFNLLTECIGYITRGLTCGIQMEMTVRVSDLMVYPCHRLGYEHLYCGQFVDDEEKGLTFKSKNTELLITTYTCHRGTFPSCIECPIKSCCVGPCLGANYESTKNMFITPPTSCLLTYALLSTSIECMMKYGIYNAVYEKLNSQQKMAYERIKRSILNVSGNN